MADVEGYNQIIDGTGAIVGIQSVQTGTIPYGPNAGRPIFSAQYAIRVNGAMVSSTNQFPVADAAANATLTTIATNQGTAAAPPSGSGMMGWLANIYSAFSGGITVTQNNGTSGTGISQPTGGTGLAGWLSGIYEALITFILQKPAPLTLNPLVNTTVNTAGTAITVLNAGQCTAGGVIHTTNTAGMYVAQLGAAGTTDSGDTMFVPANTSYEIIPNAGSVSVNATTVPLSVSGYGFS